MHCSHTALWLVGRVCLWYVCGHSLLLNTINFFRSVKRMQQGVAGKESITIKRM